MGTTCLFGCALSDGSPSTSRRNTNFHERLDMDGPSSGPNGKPHQPFSMELWVLGYSVSR
jgi:hypothetical protein